MPEVLHEAVVQVKERVVLDNANCQLTNKGRPVTGSNGERLWVMQELDEEDLKKQLNEILKKGIASLAVVLMHSYM